MQIHTRSTTRDLIWAILAREIGAAMKLTLPNFNPAAMASEAEAELARRGLDPQEIADLKADPVLRRLVRSELSGAAMRAGVEVPGGWLTSL